MQFKGLFSKLVLFLRTIEEQKTCKPLLHHGIVKTMLPKKGGVSMDMARLGVMAFNRLSCGAQVE